MEKGKLKWGMCAAVLLLAACNSERKAQTVSPVILSDECIAAKIGDYRKTIEKEVCRGKVYAVHRVSDEGTAAEKEAVGQMHVNNMGVLYFYPEKDGTVGRWAANFMVEIERVNRARQLTLKVKDVDFGKECIVSGNGGKENVRMNINVVLKKDDPLYCGGLRVYLKEKEGFVISEIKREE